MTFRWFVVGGLVAVACSISARSYADGVKVGDAAPPWSAVVGLDDKTHSLAEYKDAKAIVLVFTCNHCPIAQAYEGRLIELAKDYQSKGVQVVAVNVNNLAADRLDKMKVRATEKGFNFPYLYDPTQKMGHQYGAEVTPHVFLLDQQRKVAYIGAIDDDNDAQKVKEQYVRAALDSLLNGKSPAKAETRARGCTIKYEK